MARVYVDSSSQDSVAEWLGSGLAQGVTTNASILKREGENSLSEVAGRLLRCQPAELHLQVLAEDDDEAFLQANRLAGIDARIRVKIPILTAAGRPRTDLVRRCVAKGIGVNVTACTTLGQALAVSVLGPDYVSLLWGRIGDGGADPAAAVAQFTSLPEHERPSLIVGSLRSTADITDAWVAGADVVTVAPRLLHEWIGDPGSVAIADQFRRDGAGLVL